MLKEVWEVYFCKVGGKKLEQQKKTKMKKNRKNGCSKKTHGASLNAKRSFMSEQVKILQKQPIEPLLVLKETER